METSALFLPLPSSVASFVRSIAAAPACEQSVTDLLADARALARADGFVDETALQAAVSDAWNTDRDDDFNVLAERYCARFTFDTEPDVDDGDAAMADAFARAASRNAWASPVAPDAPILGALADGATSADVAPDATGDALWSNLATTVNRNRIDRALAEASDALDSVGADGVASKIRRLIGRGPATIEYAERTESRCASLIRFHYAL